MQNDGSTKTIVDSRGRVILVDEQDHEWLSYWRWSGGSGYARGGPRGSGSPRHMHRMIMLPDLDEDIDHINGNGLDNRRSNLRVCSRGQNLANQRPQSGRSSRYKGVCWCKRDLYWTAHIKTQRRMRSLGTYTDEVSAALAYDRAAIVAFGEFAHTNFLANGTI